MKLRPHLCACLGVGRVPRGYTSSTAEKRNSPRGDSKEELRCGLPGKWGFTNEARLRSTPCISGDSGMQLRPRLRACLADGYCVAGKKDGRNGTQLAGF